MLGPFHIAPPPVDPLQIFQSFMLRYFPVFLGDYFIVIENLNIIYIFIILFDQSHRRDDKKIKFIKHYNRQEIVVKGHVT